MQDKTEEELANECLSVALEITGSRIGFVGLVGDDGLLHDIAISDMGWEQCLMYDKTGHRRPPGSFILHGLSVVSLKVGKDFLLTIRWHIPTDLGLPDSNGIDTFFDIHTRNSRILIIIFTGSNTEKNGIDAVKKGAQDYLVKGQIDGRLLKFSIQYSIECKMIEEVLATI